MNKNLQELLNTLEGYVTEKYRQGKDNNGFCMYTYDLEMCVIGRYLHNQEYDLSNLNDNPDIQVYLEHNPEVYYKYFSGIPIKTIKLVQQCHDYLHKDHFVNLFYNLKELKEDIPEWLHAKVTE